MGGVASSPSTTKLLEVRHTISIRPCMNVCYENNVISAVSPLGWLVLRKYLAFASPSSHIRTACFHPGSQPLHLPFQRLQAPYEGHDVAYISPIELAEWVDAATCHVPALSRKTFRTQVCTCVNLGFSGVQRSS